MTAVDRWIGLIITGSRFWPEDAVHGDIIWRHIDDLFYQARIENAGLIVHHGDCPTGADAVADSWTRSVGPSVKEVLKVRGHPADWDNCDSLCNPAHRRPKKPGDVVHPGSSDTYCPAAGFRRNYEMVETVLSQGYLRVYGAAFYYKQWSAGTGGCHKLMVNNNIPVRAVQQDGVWPTKYADQFGNRVTGGIK